MKFLILLAVILVAAWWTFGRRRPGRGAAPPPPPQSPNAAPQAMLSCAHCNVHLPPSEAVFDAEQRPFCSEAHRLAGPRGTGSGSAG